MVWAGGRRARRLRRHLPHVARHPRRPLGLRSKSSWLCRFALRRSCPCGGARAAGSQSRPRARSERLGSLASPHQEAAQLRKGLGRGKPRDGLLRPSSWPLAPADTAGDLIAPWHGASGASVAMRLAGESTGPPLRRSQASPRRMHTRNRSAMRRLRDPKNAGFIRGPIFLPRNGPNALRDQSTENRNGREDSPTSLFICSAANPAFTRSTNATN